MILHDAVIENKVINEAVIDSTEEFIDKLLAASDLMADVYINTHKAFSSKVTMTVNNGYMMANVDGRFALSKQEVIDSILIQVRQSGNNTIILSSFTMFGEMMDVGDYDADLFFKVINVVPNCTLKCFISDSKFKALRTAKLPPIVLEEQPVAPGYDIEPVEYHLEEPYNVNPFYILKNGGNPENQEDVVLVTYGITFNVNAEVEKLIPTALDESIFNIANGNPFNFSITSDSMTAQELTISGNSAVKSGIVLPVLHHGNEVGTATLILRSNNEQPGYALYEPIKGSDWELGKDVEVHEPIRITE